MAAMTPGNGEPAGRSLRHCAALPAMLAAGAILTGCAAPEKSGGRDGAVDLTRRPWFPPIVRQQSFSCAQQVALYYLLTAEWNRDWNRSAASPFRRFSPYHAYSMLAGGGTGRSHVVDGWILARETGVPLESDCPSMRPGLMHGFDRYLRAMRYRAKDWQVLPLTNTDGVSKAKRLLDAGHPLACDFRIRGTVLQPVAGPGCSKMVTAWGREGPGHSMVYAGYDDSVGWDVNRDGRLTNDLDINGDGAITLADHERGAFLVINPWGAGWGDRGRAWAPYRLHAVTTWPWSRSVATVSMADPRQPRLVLRLSMKASDRQNVIVAAGAGSRRMQPWMFSHEPASPGAGGVWDSLTTLRTPGPHLSPGTLTGPGGGPLETGHDLTALGRASRYSLEVRPAGRGALNGELTAASFLEYDSSGKLIRETKVSGLPASLPPGGGQWNTAE